MQWNKTGRVSFGDGYMTPAIGDRTVLTSFVLTLSCFGTRLQTASVFNEIG